MEQAQITYVPLVTTHTENIINSVCRHYTDWLKIPDRSRLFNADDAVALTKGAFGEFISGKFYTGVSGVTAPVFIERESIMDFLIQGDPKLKISLKLIEVKTSVKEKPPYALLLELFRSSLHDLKASDYLHDEGRSARLGEKHILTLDAGAITMGARKRIKYDCTQYVILSKTYYDSVLHSRAAKRLVLPQQEKREKTGKRGKKCHRVLSLDND